MKRTALFDVHKKLGGRLIEFGGWEMPVQYTSIVDEHLAVRHAAGLFDISHMGEVGLEGPSSEAFLNQVLTNDIKKLAPGQGQYTLLCNQQGRVIDDLYAYRLSPGEYLLIVNASRIEADLAWLEKCLEGFGQRSGVTLRNFSGAMSAVAIQGPDTAKFIDRSVSGASVGGTLVTRVTDLKKNQIGRFMFEGAPVWLGRTGYTGEDGFEIVAPNELIVDLW